MSDCCSGGSCALNATQERQRGTLRIVLAINAVMFVVIVAAALYAGSTALLSDSIDNLGDALTYALSLWAITQGAGAKARVALFKGALIFIAACAVAGQIVYKLVHPETPLFEVMGAFSLLGLAANGACLWLLWRHRHEDINMSSVWECSRNDVASNLAVFAAAGGVWLFDAAWPDLLVASALVLLLLRSSLRVVTGAWGELRHGAVARQP
jgi:Co/Zn/Cd efflux system component